MCNFYFKAQKLKISFLSIWRLFNLEPQPKLLTLLATAAEKNNFRKNLAKIPERHQLPPEAAPQHPSAVHPATCQGLPRQRGEPRAVQKEQQGSHGEPAVPEKAADAGTGAATEEAGLPAHFSDSALR